MKTRTINRILEATFLFAIILLIYVMSIFTAKGQMTRELSAPHEIILSYANEESFNTERIMSMDKYLLPASIRQGSIKSKELKFNSFAKRDKNEVPQSKILMPKNDLRRRRIQKYQAPSFLIPFN
ncbi:hypothetical protein [Ekhidna sp.]|uniref:hypothetical protein n=1 Tax=Ekhidna sp. TaxID=2608089 RepID=UPI003BA8FD95